uniref:PRO2760 n=1 Tax=Homo sapiens TaxID=9606 RepID=Q9P150_HUMAN|nr:PRO2760 [Homo sapiens]
MVGWQEGANHKNGAGRSQKQEMAEKMVPEVASGEEIGGRSEAGRESPDLFRPNTVEARDRPAGPPFSKSASVRVLQRSRTNRDYIPIEHIQSPIGIYNML